MIKREEFLKAVNIIIKYKAQIDIDTAIMPLIQEIIETIKDADSLMVYPQFDMSVRLFNLIRMYLATNNFSKYNNTDFTIQEAQKIPVSELQKIPNFGERSLAEFTDILKSAGLTPTP